MKIRFYILLIFIDINQIQHCFTCFKCKKRYILDLGFSHAFPALFFSPFSLFLTLPCRKFRNQHSRINNLVNATENGGVWKTTDSTTSTSQYACRGVSIITNSYWRFFESTNHRASFSNDVTKMVEIRPFDLLEFFV